jgi:hypothetical protein
MFGARPDTDQIPRAAPRSSQFADKYSNRFFVSGISGSLKKHYDTYHKKLRDGKDSDIVVRHTAPIFEKRVETELENGVKKLAELENKLNQIRIMKEQRRLRDEKRQFQKRQFLSAKKIQRFFLMLVQRKKNSVKVLMSFLQWVRRKEALAAANWAIETLRRFVHKV